MREGRIKIGVVAPGSRIEPIVAEKVLELAGAVYPALPPDVYFHPQCFRSSGHFAGDDEARAQAFLEVANDESFDVLWFARGGYGSCRLAKSLLPKLTAAARNKVYLGYSDAGFLLACLYKEGFRRMAHGPMPADINRENGDVAIKRALSFLIDRAADSIERTVSATTVTAAFNITILSHLVGTPLQPDLADHILMLEEVAEHMYRIDRSLFHITSNPDIRTVKGIMLGRCSAIPSNEPPFGQTEEEVITHWCSVSGIPYLGRADIGHDINNKVVPLGRWWSA
jgi:muramoyltetrapeptide carboxypeptidase